MDEWLSSDFAGLVPDEFKNLLGIVKTTLHSMRLGQEPDFNKWDGSYWLKRMKPHVKHLIPRFSRPAQPTEEDADPEDSYSSSEQCFRDWMKKFDQDKKDRKLDPKEVNSLVPFTFVSDDEDLKKGLREMANSLKASAQAASADGIASSSACAAAAAEEPVGRGALEFQVDSFFGDASA